MLIIIFSFQFYAKDPNSTLTTVQTRDPLMARVIGQRQELSFYDVKLANMAYCDGEWAPVENGCLITEHAIKEGVLLRNVSPSLVLCDHFPGGGILELQTGSSWEWPFIVCLFWE